jgi:hypothetical protein
MQLRVAPALGATLLLLPPLGNPKACLSERCARVNRVGQVWRTAPLPRSQPEKGHARGIANPSHQPAIRACLVLARLHAVRAPTTCNHRLGRPEPLAYQRCTQHVQEEGPKAAQRHTHGASLCRGPAAALTGLSWAGLWPWLVHHTPLDIPCMIGQAMAVAWGWFDPPHAIGLVTTGLAARLGRAN